MSALASAGFAASIDSAGASGPCQTAARMNASRSSSVFDKPVARVRIVVDAVLLFQLLDLPEIRFGVRAGDAVADRLARVPQDLREAAARGHPLVRGEILQQRREPLLETHRHVHPLDLQRRRVVMTETVAEGQRVTVAIADAEIAQAPRAIARLLQHLDAVRPVERIQ